MNSTSQAPRVLNERNIFMDEEFVKSISRIIVVAYAACAALAIICGVKIGTCTYRHFNPPEVAIEQQETAN